LPSFASWAPALQGAELRGSAWRKLAELAPEPDVALLQEDTRPPDEMVGTFGGVEDGRVGSLIWSPRLELLEPHRLQDVGDRGYVALARVAAGDPGIALISFHARTTGPGAVANIEALFDRLGDVFSRGSFVLGGDFNSCRLAEETWPGCRHREFFERVEEDYGMHNCYWREYGEERRTYWQDCEDAGTPFQDDHIFVSADLGGAMRSCEVLDYEPFRGISDHAPVVTELDLDSLLSAALRS
jgi:endonuclease/exonuclease/phosphatase family metal-dependent hydrolase